MQACGLATKVSMDVECYQCKKTDEEGPIRKCRVCHKHFCEDHSASRSGVAFCSRGCSVYFFHTDEDEEHE
jgi:hypothetical protein